MADKSGIADRGGSVDFLFGEIGIDEPVDWVGAVRDDGRQFDLTRLQRRLIGWRFQRKTFLPGQAGVDPVFKERDFFVVQSRAFGRHLFFFVAGEDAAEKLALVAASGHDCDAAFAAGDDRGAGVHRIATFFRFARVALAAVFADDWYDVVGEFNGLGGVGDKGKEKCRGCDQHMERRGWHCWHAA